MMERRVLDSAARLLVREMAGKKKKVTGSTFWSRWDISRVLVVRCSDLGCSWILVDRITDISPQNGNGFEGPHQEWDPYGSTINF